MTDIVKGDFSLSRSELGGSGINLGQLAGGSSNQESTKKCVYAPLDAQSAGFSSPFTWFHWSGPIRSTVAYIGLKSPRVSNEPIQHNSAIGPSEHRAEG